MSLPQRHGPAQYHDTQKLQLPQELVDIIADDVIADDVITANIDRNERKACILRLRLTCHTFAEGLFHPFVTSYLQIYSRFVFYIDDQGIEDIEWLANSRLAPFVQYVQLADRVTSLRVLEFHEVDEKSKQKNVKTINWRVDQMADWQAQYGMALVFTQPHAKCPEGDVRLGLAHECKRNERHRAGFTALHLGWSVKEMLMDCCQVHALNLRPSLSSTRRLATALRKFPNIASISTSREPQVLARSRDLEGKVVTTTTMHGTDAMMDYSKCAKLNVKCVCAPIARPSLRCSHSEDDVIWPAVADISLLMPMLSSDLPLFTTLTDLDFSFYSNIAVDAARDDVEDYASSIAVFVSQCTALERLCLRASTGETKSPATSIYKVSEAVVYSIEKVFRSLTHPRKLRHLDVDHIDPTSPRVLEFLANHAAHLTSLALPTCLSTSWSGDSNYVKQWGVLLAAVAGSDSLTHLKFNFLEKGGPSRAVSRVQYLVRHMDRHDERIRKLMFKLARAFKGWNGDINSLIEIQLK